MQFLDTNMLQIVEHKQTQLDVVDGQINSGLHNQDYFCCAFTQNYF